MYKQAPKSPAMKALVGNQKNLPAGLKAQIEASPGKMMNSPAKQATKNKNLGGQPIAGMDSAADVPRSTSFNGTNYKLGMLSGRGADYYNEGYNHKDGKKGTINRPGDDGIYHVSRAVEKPVNKVSAKTASIPQSKSKLKLAVVNTTKPTKPTTKKQERRSNRADKLESRAKKLRGTA